MDSLIINEKEMKKYTAVKAASRIAKKYYGDRLFDRSVNEPKTRIRKL